MLIDIKNIGLINDSTVELSGLTIIAGKNDSGKSTIGKLIFSIVKSISRYKEDLEEDKEHNIKKIIDKIYFNLRRRLNFDDNIEVKKLFQSKQFYEDILFKKNEAISIRRELILSLKIGNLEHINEWLGELEFTINQNDSKEESIKRAFKKILYSEFLGEITNKNNNLDSQVIIKEKSNDILEIKFSDVKDIDFKIYDELYFNDATIIETPMILNYQESISNSKTYFEIRDKKDRLYLLGMPNTPLHIKDLDTKLKDSIYDNNLFQENSLLQEKIYEIINGKMMYIQNEQEFVYLKKDGKKYNNINTANGIKSFGIIQMLENGGFLDDRSLIVIDEPEVHLHPKWQIKYAELIVELVKADINVLITTHSPYMLEALEIYSKSVKDKMNYYISKEIDNKFNLYNVNSDLEQIYKELSEPFLALEKLSIEDFEW